MRKENYLDKKPVIKNGLSWYRDAQGVVTLKLENSGFLNKMWKMILGRPDINYVHLDELGSFVWMQLNGKNDIYAIGKKLEAKYGDDVEPLYFGLVKYFKILESYKFIEWA